MANFYVDPLISYARRPFGHRDWCHLTTDGTVDELHTFAVQLGLKRSWFQDKRIPHYDLTASKRALALQLGAIATDWRGVAQHGC